MNAVVINEVASIVISAGIGSLVTATETVGLRITEGATGVGTAAASDSTAVGVGESAEVVAAGETLSGGTSDAVQAGVSERPTLQTTVAAPDSVATALGESAHVVQNGLTALVSASDSVRVRAGEDAAIRRTRKQFLYAYVTAGDSLGVRTSEVSALVDSLARVYGTDSLGTRAVDTATGVGTGSASDTAGVRTTEVASLAVNGVDVITGSDTAAVAASESAVLVTTLASAEAIAVALTEAAVNVVSVAAAENVATSVAETARVTVSVAATDSIGIRTTDTTSVSADDGEDGAAFLLEDEATTAHLLRSESDPAVLVLGDETRRNVAPTGATAVALSEGASVAVVGTGSGNSLLLETGDLFLLETGDQLLLETESEDLVLLATLTASASTTLSFTTRNATGQSGAIIQSDYDEYVVRMTAINPSTNTQDLRMRISTNGGSSYDSSSNYYGAVALIRNDGVTTAINNSGTYFLLATSVDNSYEGVATTVLIINPSSALRKGFRFESSFSQSVGFYTGPGGGIWNLTTALNAFQFYFASGNIASGEARVYGIVKT